MILAPGVQNTTDLRSRKAAFNNGLSQWGSDGAGEKRNDFTIDGVANVAADRVAYSPPSAAVEEFKIQTATYDAALGNAMGASVNLVTKSGTNTFRGQAYEWYRGAGLDARNFFDKKAGRPKRDYKDNRFGAAAGGPIVRNRTFYFANVEANPFQVPSPAILTVPTERMRGGDFSELLALGPQYQIYDPATTRPHPTQAGRFIRDPFPGNIIPAGRISPVARNILGFYPLPNQAGTSDGANNYNNPTAVAFETYYTATARVDHNLSDRHRLYGRFSWDFWEEEKDDRFDNLSTGIFLNRKNRVFAIDDAYTLKSNLLVNVRGGFTRQLFPERRRSQGFDLSSLGFASALTGWCRPTSRPSRTSPSTGTRRSAHGSRGTASSRPTSTTPSAACCGSPATTTSSSGPSTAAMSSTRAASRPRSRRPSRSAIPGRGVRSTTRQGRRAGRISPPSCSGCRPADR